MFEERERPLFLVEGVEEGSHGTHSHGLLSGLRRKEFLQESSNRLIYCLSPLRSPSRDYQGDKKTEESHSHLKETSGSTPLEGRPGRKAKALSRGAGA